MHITLKQMLRAIPLVAVTAATTTAAVEAHAGQQASCGLDPYYDPCADLTGWIDIAVLSSGTIPADGVLLLQGAVQGGQPALKTVSVTVTTGGEPVAGAIEATDLPGAVIWRPTAPWTPGATYQISGAATNPDADGECLTAELPLSGEVVIDTAPASAVSPVEVAGVELLKLQPEISLSSLVCCAGAGPQQNPGDCDNPGSIQFDPDQCTPSRGDGFFDLTLTGSPAAEGPVAQQVLYALKIDDAPAGMSVAPMFGLGSLTQPVCAAIDVIDLGSGTVVAGAKKCFGETLVDKLGPQTVDPGATLVCELQHCETNANGDGWDLDHCSPFDPSDPPTTGVTDAGGDAGDSSDGAEGGQDGDKGACACDAALGPGPGLLALLGLLGFTRRRRRASR